MPAVIIMARFQCLMLFIDLLGSICTPSNSGGTASASPYIETNPPNGIALKENLVSPFLRLKDNSRGPNPKAYSKQYTLKIFAVIKCPASWTMIRVDKQTKKRRIYRNVIIYVLLTH